MAVGLQVFNDSGTLTIDSSYSCMVYAFRGNFVVTNSVVDRASSVTVNFQRTITSTSPPRLFVRLTASRHASCNLYIRFRGSAGAWTGFTFTTGALGGGTLPRHEFEYVICETFNNTVTGNVGMELYDEQGRRTYFTGSPLVQFAKVTKSWTTSISYDSSGFTRFVNITPNGIVIDSDDFIDVSPFDEGVVWQDGSVGDYMSLVIRENSAPMLKMQTQHLYDDVQGSLVSDRYFCLPICKFPTNRFP